MLNVKAGDISRDRQGESPALGGREPAERARGCGVVGAGGERTASVSLRGRAQLLFLLEASLSRVGNFSLTFL